MKSKKIISAKGLNGRSMRIGLLPKGVNSQNDRIRFRLTEKDGSFTEIGLRVWEASFIVTGFSLAISSIKGQASRSRFRKKNRK